VSALAGSAIDEDRGFLPFEGDAAEPCDQGFLVPVADADGLEAGARPVRGLDDGLLLLPERYSAVSRDQWLPAPFAFDDRLEARARPVRGIDFGFMLRRRLRYGRAVLAR